MTFFWIDVESSQVQAGLSVFQISNYSVSPLHTQKKSHGGNWRVLHNWKNCKWSFMKNCRKNEAVGSKYESTMNFLIWSLNILLPPIAQLVEHQTSDKEVMSSSLTWGSILLYARLCTVISHCVVYHVIHSCIFYSRYRTIFLKWLPQGLVFLGILKGQESIIWALLALNRSFWGPQNFKNFDFSKLKNKSVDNKCNYFSIN
jgi:hypothetical protein